MDQGESKAAEDLITAVEQLTEAVNDLNWQTNENKDDLCAVLYELFRELRDEIRMTTTHPRRRKCLKRH